MRVPWRKAEPEPAGEELDELRAVSASLIELAAELRDNQRRLMAQIELMEASRD